MAQDPNRPDDRAGTSGTKKGAGPNLFDSDFAQSVKDSAQQIWLAGLAAFAKAQAEGGKIFDTLAKEGADLQKKTQAAVDEKAADFGSKWSDGKWADIAADVQGKATQQWSRFEEVLEDRTARALNRIGAPSAKDFAALTARVDALSAKVDQLATVRKPAAKASAKAPAKKTAAKKTSLKKAPAKRKV